MHAHDYSSHGFPVSGRITADRVYAFDIFDTLLTRLVGAPAAVFYFAGKVAREKGLVDVDPAAFHDCRIEAERNARLLAPRREITLEDIYDQLEQSLGIGDHTVSAIKDIEVELEERFLYAVPQVADLLEIICHENAKTYLISDMYLPKATILRFLRRNNVDFEPTAIYLSSEFGVTKRSGRLFRKFLVKEGLSPARVTYIGNNDISDCRVPKKLGFKVAPFTDANLNRYERLMERHSSKTNGVSSLMAGASRAVRLLCSGNDQHSNQLAQVSCGVVAPVLLGFVFWILRQAERMEIERLYFIARDGQLLYDVAKVVSSQLGLELDLRYVFGSRQAWHPASLGGCDTKDSEWILRKVDMLTLERVLSRLNISPSEIAVPLSTHGFPESSWQNNLSPEDIDRIGKVLLEPDLRRYMLRRSSETRRLVSKYLEQEGFLDDRKKAIVDLGWNGRMHRSLALILRAVSPADIGSFYFGLKRRPNDEELGFRRTYFDEIPFGSERGFSVPDLAPLMEMFCSANHGHVVGYVENKGRIEPVLEESHGDAVARWGVSVVHRAVTEFLRHLDFELFPRNVLPGMVELSGQLLSAFWVAPDRSEAVEWGTYPFEDDQVGGLHRPIAEVYRLSDLADVFARGSLSRYDGNWVGGSLVTTPGYARLAARVSAFAGKKLQAVARRVLPRQRDN